MKGEEALDFLFLPTPGAPCLLENLLPQTDRLRRHLYQFIVADQLDSVFQSHLQMGCDQDIFVAAGGPDIGQFLLFADIDVEVVVARVLADDHAFVYADSRSDEESPPLLEMEDSVGGRHALAVRHHGAVVAGLDRPVPGSPAVEQRVHDSRAPRIGEKARAESDQPSRWHGKLEANAAGPAVNHLGHLAPPDRE